MVRSIKMMRKMPTITHTHKHKPNKENRSKWCKRFSNWNVTIDICVHRFIILVGGMLTESRHIVVWLKVFCSCYSIRLNEENEKKKQEVALNSFMSECRWSGKRNAMCFKRKNNSIKCAHIILTIWWCFAARKLCAISMVTATQNFQQLWRNWHTTTICKLNM